MNKINTFVMAIALCILMIGALNYYIDADYYVSPSYVIWNHASAKKNNKNNIFFNNLQLYTP